MTGALKHLFIEPPSTALGINIPTTPPCNYNMATPIAHRLRLENIFYLELFGIRSSNGFQSPPFKGDPRCILYMFL
jgi:hypothetical protein